MNREVSVTSLKEVQKEQGWDFTFHGGKSGHRHLPRPGFRAVHTINSPSSRLAAPAATLMPASRGAPSGSQAAPPSPPRTDQREARAVLRRPSPRKQRAEGVLPCVLWSARVAQLPAHR